VAGLQRFLLFRRLDARRLVPCRLFFDPVLTASSIYAGDRREPPHVHVERDTSEAKLWLEPVSLQSSAGFSRAELNEIQRLMVQDRRP